MTRRLAVLAALGGGAVIGLAADAPWPLRLHEFELDALPQEYQHGDTLIGVRAADAPGRIPRDPDAGPVLEFSVEDLRRGQPMFFLAQAVAAAVVDSSELAPEIEVWRAAGAQTYLRCAYRPIGDRYCCRQQETFVVASDAAATESPYTLPGRQLALEYAGSQPYGCERDWGR